MKKIAASYSHSECCLYAFDTYGMLTLRLLIWFYEQPYKRLTFIKGFEKKRAYQETLGQRGVGPEGPCFSHFFIEPTLPGTL
jgi:hypothetical protein